MTKLPQDNHYIRVIIADDHELLRQSIRSLLAKESRIQIVAEAADGQQALELTKKLQPDVIILDITMPNLNGLRVALRLQKIQTKVLIVSHHIRVSFVRYAVKYGVKGYVLKSALQELVEAVLAVNQGHTFFTEAIKNKIGKP